MKPKLPYVGVDCLAEDHQTCESEACSCWCHLEEDIDFSEYDEMMKHFDDDKEND